VADGVAITAGSGTTIKTDDRSSVHVQVVYDIGGTTYANGQVAPTSTAATLLAANTERRSVIFQNVGSVAVWIGAATVTTANGFLLPVGASIELTTTALIQAITASGTGNVSYIDIYNS